MKRSFADILQELDGAQAKKVARKLPEWAAADAEIPSALALEQCSSTATALYKCSLAVQTALPGTDKSAFDKVLDLTGGLGVDSWAFSQVAKKVIYYEQHAELAAAAVRNFTRLGAEGIEVRCETVTPQTALPEADLIYADPARRNAAGRKVFLLEDCTPDILTLLPLLLRKAPAVLLKVSPMADLSMLSGRLGSALREIHVVEAGGEVKEILCLLRHDTACAEPEIVVARLRTSPEEPQPARTGAPAGQEISPRSAAEMSDRTLRFRPQEEREAEAEYAAGVQPGRLLLEPAPALLKAGAFKLPCKRLGLLKLAHSTHLYTTGPDRAAETGFAPLRPEAAAWFKACRILEVLPFGSASFKDLKRRFPRAEVTARNLPLDSAALQKKTGISPGGDTRIFACRLADGRAVLIICAQP
ncbi:MAG: hypothetical protein IJV37_05085 [Bacteroidales bacterium]|nr:hypothetical protein [Bacteroidales bacterium]